MLHDPRWQIKHDAKQTLLNAAQYLETHDWCQGAMSFDGKVCMFGAIKAVNCRGDYPEHDHEVCYRLRQIVGTGAVYWNDAKGRTKRQVINALKAAAEI